MVAYASACGMTVIPIVTPAIKSATKSFVEYFGSHCRMGTRIKRVFLRKIRSFRFFHHEVLPARLGLS